MHENNAVVASKGAVSAVGFIALMLLSDVVLATDTLPAGVGTAVTAMQTNGQAIFDLIFPVVALLVGLTVIIKLFKRFSSKV